MGLLDLISTALKPKPSHMRQKAKCPKCKADVTLDMERCQKCGTHIESMFRIECPKCKEQNEINAQKCKKCGYSFTATSSESSRSQYRCPICGYVADYYMLSCPSCGIKFIS